MFAFRMNAQRGRLPAGFIVVALMFYAIDGAIVHSPVFAEQPGLLAGAASFDLTLGVTLMWWLMVVRRGRAPFRSLLPVFVASVAAAMVTLPAGHRDLLHDLRYLAIPCELAVMMAIVVGVRATNRRLAAAGAELDVPERIRALFDGQVPPRIAEIVSTEASMFYFALASWRRRPFVPAGSTAFSYHKKNGLAGILYTVALASVVETFVVDLLIRIHHPHAANALLAIGLFAVIWLLGFARAVQLRPMLVTHDTLQLRMGLQWMLDVPRTNISSIAYGRASVPPRGTAGYLRLTPQPNVVLTLHEPMRAHGPYGMRRDVTRIGIALDDIKKFECLLNT